MYEVEEQTKALRGSGRSSGYLRYSQISNPAAVYTGRPVITSRRPRRTDWRCCEAARPSPSKPGKRDAAVKPIFSKEFSASARHSDRTACQRGNTSGVAAHHLRVLRCRSSPEHRPVNPLPSRLDWAVDHLDSAARRMDPGNHSDSRHDKSPLPQLTIIAVLVSGDEPHAFTVGSGVLTQRVVATSSIRPPGPARHRCEWPSEPP